MIKLKVREVVNSRGNFVNVYDDEAEVKFYRNTGKWENYTYYIDINGKLCKTRPYVQWTSMTNRTLDGGSHQKKFSSYEGVTVSKNFKDFDYWVSWAEKQVGFMCVDDKGRLYQQDKDLLGDGKLYSEDTCCFVSPKFNCVEVNLRKVTKTEYIDRGYGFELKNSNQIFDYKYIDFISKFNSKLKFRDVFDEYFSEVDEKIIDRLIDYVDETTFSIKENTEIMKGKISCERYEPCFDVLIKRNLSGSSCHGAMFGYKGKIKYSMSLCGYDWIKLIFDKPTISFDNKLTLIAYTLVLRILITNWYLRNEVIPDETKIRLSESVECMLSELKTFKEYQLESFTDFCGIYSFEDLIINKINEFAGGMKLEKFL